MPQLLVTIQGEEPQRHSVAGDEITIGRGEGNTLRLAGDVCLSRFHCRIRRLRDGYVLEDVGSQSGTWLNDRTVGRDGAALRPGDRVRIGRTDIVFDPPEGEPPQEADASPGPG